jgi:hypothetical protein
VCNVQWQGSTAQLCTWSYLVQAAVPAGVHGHTGYWPGRNRRHCLQPLPLQSAALQKLHLVSSLASQTLWIHENIMHESQTSDHVWKMLVTEWRDLAQYQMKTQQLCKLTPLVSSKGRLLLVLNQAPHYEDIWRYSSTYSWLWHYMRQVFSEYFGLTCQFSFHWLLYAHHLSSWTGTIGRIVTDVPSGLSLTHPKKPL